MPPVEEEKKDAPAEGEVPAEGAEGEEAVRKEEVVEEEVKLMALDEFYPDDHVEKEVEDSALPKRSMKFFECLGQSSYKRYNFHWLGDQDFIFVAANTYQIYNINTGKRRIFFGTDVDGIGSVCVHPSRKYFAVAEKGTNPNVYIYEWPSLKLYRVQRKGTEKMYAHVEWSTSGEKLASLGGAPDYTLTVWDWLAQKVILRTKAFGQEVFRVSFSPYTDDILFTAGSGHIKFWKMAQTFTGLKLQGEIAKFGQLELSDQAAFYELPDGKVVSGCENGNLIVWEGQFVKSHLMLDVERQTPLHNGFIEVLLQDGDYYVTAAHDGYIKWWRISDIDGAEAEEGLDFAIQPVREILIEESTGKNPAIIVNMILAGKTWFIQDARGKMYKMAYETENYTEVYQFNQGQVKDIISSPVQNYVITLGENGMIKVWDYVNRKVVYQETYIGEGTCLEHMPQHDGNKGRVFAAGFDNGVVRVFMVTADGLKMLKSFKAHDDPIVGIKFSADLKQLVTGSTKGDVFFFDIDGSDNIQKFEALCTVKLPDDGGINDFKFTDDDKSIIFGCNTGFVYQIERPVTSQIDNSDSYLWTNPNIKTWRIKIMEFQMKKNQQKDEAEEEKKRRMRLRGELPPEEDEPEEDWDPESIRTIVPYTDAEGKKNFIISSEGQFNGFIYLCDIEQVRPFKAIEIKPEVLVTFMELRKSNTGNILTIGYNDGSIENILNMDFDRRQLTKMHDAHNGSINAAKFSKDENFFFSVAQDGLLLVHQFDKDTAIEDQKYDPLAGVEGANFMPAEEKKQVAAKRKKEYQAEHKPIFSDTNDADLAMDEAALSITMKTTEPLDQDADHTAYSIQQSKLRTEEDHRLTLAERKKEKVRDQITDLRNTFLKIFTKNVDAEDHLRITEDDFQIDPDFFAILQERNDQKIEETKKEVAWNIEFNTLKLNKLKNKYYDVLEFEKFTVKSIKQGSYVTTFRVQKMSEFLQTNIEAFKQMLENEIVGKENDNDDEFMDDESKNENPVDNEKQKEKDKAAALLAKQKAAQQAALNAKKSQGEKVREQRKLEREERKRKIERLEKKEAMHSGEDPEDRKEIEIARATFGDYKLKTSGDYTVPENQRVNFSKKRQQMVLLEGSIHKLKVDFNQKIQELKLRKKEIVDHVTKLNKRLGEINTELVVKNDALFEPKIDKAVEYPENFFEITDEDIEAHQAKKAGQKSAREQQDEEEEEEKPDFRKQQCVSRKNAKAQSTDIDKEFAQIKHIELVFEKEQKKKEIDELISAFDDEIREMQKEKYRLESDLKNAEMKLILFFEELILLKSMESKDIQLTKRLASCRQEKGQILKEINEISRKLKDKKKEIDEIKEKEEDLMIKFHDHCPERSDKYEEIRKFFEKIIKRRRRVEKPEKGENEDEDEDEDAEEEEEMEEDEDEDEDENTIAGLSPEEYKIEEIEKLREDRLDLYEDKEKILQFINDLEVQRKRLENKERAIKTDLEETEEEIQDFQSEKMSKLNQLQVSVVLKIKQIQNLEGNQDKIDKWEMIMQEEKDRKIADLEAKFNNDPPEDDTYLQEQKNMIQNEEDWRGHFLPQGLKDSILFTKIQLMQLIERKRFLDDEYLSLMKANKEYQRDHKQKKKEIKENEKIREVKEREYNERQMLRFGNLVDLDSLEVSGPSAVVMELQNKFSKTEKRAIKMIEEADSEFNSTQRDLTSQMKNNTNLLNLIRQLGEEELDLDKKLNDSNKAIFTDEDDGKKRHIMEEKLKIKKLLEIQAKEIETFKTEINMYKRKGGHIYTKVTTNRRVANLNQDN